MAGKIDEAMHGAALTNVSEALPHADEFLRHLEKVLASSAFHGSHRSQEFFRHLVETALTGEFERLKERILGIEIFKRDANYDTGEDSIVRVSANDVRKRLNQYYAGTPRRNFVINPVSGSYIPEFHHFHDPNLCAAEIQFAHTRSLESEITAWSSHHHRRRRSGAHADPCCRTRPDAEAGLFVHYSAVWYTASKLWVLAVSAGIIPLFGRLVGERPQHSQ